MAFYAIKFKSIKEIFYSYSRVAFSNMAYLDSVTVGHTVIVIGLSVDPANVVDSLVAVALRVTDAFMDDGLAGAKGGAGVLVGVVVGGADGGEVVLVAGGAVGADAVVGDLGVAAPVEVAGGAVGDAVEAADRAESYDQGAEAGAHV